MRPPTPRPFSHPLFTGREFHRNGLIRSPFWNSSSRDGFTHAIEPPHVADDWIAEFAWITRAAIGRRRTTAAYPLSLKHSLIRNAIGM